MSPILISLISAAFGILLSELVKRFRDNQLIKNIRHGIKAETDYNSQTLKFFWEQIKILPSSSKSENAVQDIFNFSVKFPKMKDVIFSGNLNLLSSTLKYNDIKQLYQYYDNLSKLDRQWIEINELAHLFRKQEQDIDKKLFEKMTEIKGAKENDSDINWFNAVLAVMNPFHFPYALIKGVLDSNKLSKEFEKFSEARLTYEKLKKACVEFDKFIQQIIESKPIK